MSCSQRQQLIDPLVLALLRDLRCPVDVRPASRVPNIDTGRRSWHAAKTATMRVLLQVFPSHHTQLCILLSSEIPRKQSNPI
jgi:hypothetical protein